MHVHRYKQKKCMVEIRVVVLHSRRCTHPYPCLSGVHSLTCKLKRWKEVRRRPLCSVFLSNLMDVFCGYMFRCVDRQPCRARQFFHPVLFISPFLFISGMCAVRWSMYQCRTWTWWTRRTRMRWSRWRGGCTVTGMAAMPTKHGSCRRGVSHPCTLPNGLCRLVCSARSKTGLGHVRVCLQLVFFRV